MQNTGKKIVIGMFWRFSEKITAQFVSFVVSIVLARILLPEDYGIVAIVNVFMALAEVFITSGLGTALVQKKDTNELDFSTIFWCNLILSLLLYLIFFFISPFIASFYKMPLLSPVLRVFGIRIPISAINSIQNAYVSRNMDFKKFFFATIIGTIISAFIGILMAKKGFGVWSLVIQNLSNAIIDTIVLSFIIKWYPKFIFSIKSAKPLISCGWKILATDIIGTAFNQLNSFIIGKKYTASDLAFYSKGRQFPDLINGNVSGTLIAVLFPAMSLSDDKNQIKEIRRKSLKMLEYVTFPLMFGMIAIADNMISVLLTEKWIESVFYVRVTCCVAIIGILGTTLIQEIKAIGRSDITLKLEFIKKPIYIIIIVFVMPFGVKAIAISSILIELIAFIINIYPVAKYIGFDFKTHLLDALPSFILSLIMAIIVYCIRYIILNNILCLIVQVLIGVFIYILLSFITKNENYIYLINIFRNKILR